MSHTERLPFLVDPLDTNFVAPKPINTAPKDRLEKLEEDGNLILTRKRDGYGSIGVFGHGNTCHLHSLEINEFTAKVPHLAEALSGISARGPTVIGAELIMPQDNRDNLSLVGSVLKSDPGLARELQEEHGFMQLRLFNVLVADGRSVVEEPFSERLERIAAYAKAGGEHIDLVEVLDLSLAAAKKRSTKEDWEGLVAYDRNATSGFRLDGNFRSRPRPMGCWKVKAYLEDDFVASSWRPSTAVSHHGMVRDLKIGQYHVETGAFIECGYVGNLTKTDRARLMDDSLYPFVVQVKFERRFPSGKLRSGSIMRFRDDKSPEECVFIP